MDATINGSRYRAAALWASASEEVDKRLSENFTVPITYVQMGGGQATFWLVDAARDSNATCLLTQ